MPDFLSWHPRIICTRHSILLGGIGTPGMKMLRLVFQCPSTARRVFQPFVVNGVRRDHVDFAPWPSIPSNLGPRTTTWGFWLQAGEIARLVGSGAHGRSVRLGAREVEGHQAGSLELGGPAYVAVRTRRERGARDHLRARASGLDDREPV